MRSLWHGRERRNKSIYAFHENNLSISCTCFQFQTYVYNVVHLSSQIEKPSNLDAKFLRSCDCVKLGDCIQTRPCSFYIMVMFLHLIYCVFLHWVPLVQDVFWFLDTKWVRTHLRYTVLKFYLIPIHHMWNQLEISGRTSLIIVHPLLLFYPSQRWD